MKRTCPHCGAPVQPRSRYCSACGRALGAPPAPLTEADPPPEVALSNIRRIRVEGDTLSLRELVNVVESGVRWWQSRLEDADAVTRAQAAQAIRELSQILASLSEQIARGRETMRITTRLPALRRYAVACPVCGRGNREGARFCQGCGAALGGGQPAAPAELERPMVLRLSMAARTDTGQVRRNNEDSVYAGELLLPTGSKLGLALVADGMGGARAGEHASRIAAEVMRAHLQHELDGKRPPDDATWERLLREAVRAANRTVYEQARADTARRGMGTTLTVALFAGDRVHIASVGDSRAYLLNAGGVTRDGATSAQLTSDHSLVARLVDIGQITPEEARTHPQRNILYRTIGTDPTVEVDTRSDPLEPGDVILLCSDGLFNHVTDEEMARIVLETPDAEQACARLVALANERGGSDNISVVVARVDA